MKVRMKLPACDFCGALQAEYDGVTHMGAWAFMCPGCFDTHGVGLGKDKGERLIFVQRIDRPLFGEKKP